MPRRHDSIEEAATRPGPKLNLGCGLDIRPQSEGWVNLDVAELEGVDTVHDIFHVPYPFGSESFDYILASHVIEHIPQRIGDEDGLLLVVAELHRILRPGGVLHVKVPHPDIGAAAYFANPTHYRIISPGTFDGFLGTKHTCVAYHTAARFRRMHVKENKRTYLFGGRFKPYHVRKYFRMDHLPLINETYELELFLEK